MAAETEGIFFLRGEEEVKSTTWSSTAVWLPAPSMTRTMGWRWRSWPMPTRAARSLESTPASSLPAAAASTALPSRNRFPERTSREPGHTQALQGAADFIGLRPHSLQRPGLRTAWTLRRGDDRHLHHRPGLRADLLLGTHGPGHRHPAAGDLHRRLHPHVPGGAGLPGTQRRHPGLRNHLHLGFPGLRPGTWLAGWLGAVGRQYHRALQPRRRRSRLLATSSWPRPPATRR